MAELIVSIYPEKVAQRLKCARSAIADLDVAAEGAGVAPECGSIVRFSIGFADGSINRAGYLSSGCGFAVAAADVLAEWISFRELQELHGLDAAEIENLLDRQIGQFPQNRIHCRAAAIEAMRNALADLRARRIEEYKGEIGLVCTCFGVSEETIENLIRQQEVSGVDEVGARLRAGTGCGSCRMLIQEMLDQVE